VAYEHFGLHWLKLPAFPIGVVGGAIGVFVSFRTNSCYGRWWEGRQLWGRLVNVSRHFTLQLLHNVEGSGRDIVEQIVRRQIAYVHLLRCALRDEDGAQDERVMQYLDDEGRNAIHQSSNPTAAVLNLHMRDVAALRATQRIDGYTFLAFDGSIQTILDVQGGCERIKRTPLPRAYGFLSQRMIQWFGALAPCAMVAELGWGTIPVSAMVAVCFQFISETGRILEDPFTMFYNGLPLSSMSRTIERNLLELLGTDKGTLPPSEPEVKRGVLM